jgi:hypothetical protein
MIEGRSMIGAAVALVMVAMGEVAPPAMSQQANVSVELTTELLDHWVKAIRQIGADSLNAIASRPIE